MSIKAEELGNLAASAVFRTEREVQAVSRRVHRIGGPEELEEEKSMPRKPKSEAPTIEEAGRVIATAKKALTRKKRKYTKRAKPEVHEGARAGEPTFIVDDAGRVAILHDEIRIDLTAGATKRLVVFLDKHAK